MDGITWGIGRMPITANWRSVCYGNGKFVAVSGDKNGSNIAAYSTDGINWTPSTLPISVQQKLIVYGNGEFMIMSDGGTAVYSTDGINWTPRTLPADLPYGPSCYGNGKLVIAKFDNNISACFALFVADPAGTDVTGNLKTALGAATMPEVNAAIQSAIQNTWEASY